MFTIIKRIFRDRLTAMLSYSIAGIAFVWLYIAMLPSVQQSSAQLQDILKAMPAGLMKAFGVAGIDMSSLEALLSLKQFNLVWPMMMIFFAVSLAGSLVAGEIENHAIEITLSSAKSRLEIFVGKYLGGIICLMLFVVSTILCTIPMAKLYGYHYAGANYFTLTSIASAFAWAIYSMSFFFSAIFSAKGRVYFVSGGILVAMYVLFILTTLKQSLDKLKYLSFFYYYDVNKALIYNQLDHTALYIFIAVAVIFTALAAIIFNRRDVAV